MRFSIYRGGGGWQPAPITLKTLKSLKSSINLLDFMSNKLHTHAMKTFKVFGDFKAVNLVYSLRDFEVFKETLSFFNFSL